MRPSKLALSVHVYIHHQPLNTIVVSKNAGWHHFYSTIKCTVPAGLAALPGPFALPGLLMNCNGQQSQSTVIVKHPACPTC